MFVSDQVKLHECVNGHEASEKNTYVYPNGTTGCRACRREASLKYHFKNRDRCIGMQKTWRSKNPEKVKAFNNRRTLRAYGIESKDFQVALFEQNGVCKICKNPPEDGRALAIDHCHDTGKFRGLLCRKCNSAIGLLGHDIEVLSSAIKYLLPPCS